VGVSQGLWLGIPTYSTCYALHCERAWRLGMSPYSLCPRWSEYNFDLLDTNPYENFEIVFVLLLVCHPRKHHLFAESYHALKEAHTSLGNELHPFFRAETLKQLQQQGHFSKPNAYVRQTWNFCRLLQLIPTDPFFDCFRQISEYEGFH
jgi:hypothetical protein